MDSGKGHLVPPIKAKLFYEFERKVEMQVMRGFNIFISTVGALADKRVESWSKSEPSIVTVVLDEAGQLIQPAIINLLNLKPSRIILAGDHHQLPPTVLSYAASSAGYNKSIMEITSWTAAIGYFLFMVFARLCKIFIARSMYLFHVLV